MNRSLRLSKKELLQLYERLLMARLCDEKIRTVYPQDEIKSPVHLSIGEEAIPVGVSCCLPSGSQYFGTYRNHALYLATTNDVEGFFAELYGRKTGTGRGKAGSMHLMAPQKGFLASSAVVSTTIPVAVGAAFAAKYQNSSRWTAVFFGDGAVEEGVFWESLNFACLHRLQILFVCEDNELAIHTHPPVRRGFRSIAHVAREFDCYSASGNGTKITDVMTKTQTMMMKMKQSMKPGFLHFSYYRHLEHVGIREDFDAGYRRRPSARMLRQADPLAFASTLLDRQGVTETERRRIEAAIQKRIETSVKKARQAPFPSTHELLTEVLA
jgi:TPP-dependent pyruvate/acetoin dehydrogenase alpha subunit